MKIKLFFLLLLVSTLRTWAQTIVSPTYSRRDNISGNYVGGTSINITFVDYINGYTWNISQFELPNKSPDFVNVSPKIRR